MLASVDLILLGDDRATRALEDLRARADALECQNILYIVDVLDVMLSIRAGRLDDAESAAARCYHQGVSVGEVDAIGYLGAHTLAIRWIQGRDAEILEAAEDFAGSNTLVEAESGSGQPPPPSRRGQGSTSGPAPGSAGCPRAAGAAAIQHLAGGHGGHRRGCGRRG